MECPGAACELLGLEKLRTLFCNAELSRADIAYDGAPFTPEDLAGWAREGNIRTRAEKIYFGDNTKGGDGESDKLTIGSRSSEQYLRAYDKCGFTRLELKGMMARGFKDVLLSELDEVGMSTIGMLRQ